MCGGSNIDALMHEVLVESPGCCLLWELLTLLSSNLGVLCFLPCFYRCTQRVWPLIPDTADNVHNWFPLAHAGDIMAGCSHYCWCSPAFVVMKFLLLVRPMSGFSSRFGTGGLTFSLSVLGAVAAVFKHKRFQCKRCTRCKHTAAAQSPDQAMLRWVRTAESPERHLLFDGIIADPISTACRLLGCTLLPGSE